MDEKYKVTYILGAGASCNAEDKLLPLVSEYSQALDSCALALDDLNLNGQNNLISEIQSILKEVAAKGQEHRTVDTYARWCYRKDPRALNNLKRALTFFFSYNQFYRGARDPRYNQFITELIDDEFNFPKNVKILNWNYDSQVQLACDMNKPEEFAFMQQIQQTHYKPGIINYYPTITSRSIQNNKIDYDMVHLNGMADIFKSREFGNLPMSFKSFSFENVNSLMRLFDPNNESHFFNFAFEKKQSGYEIDDRIKIAKELIKDTDVLVIIGYSFPPVNNSVDKELFNVFESRKAIKKKIYIQSPSVSPKRLASQFTIDTRYTDIEVIDNLFSFHIALEYNQVKLRTSEFLGISSLV